MEVRRLDLAAFCVNSFRQYERRSRMSCEAKKLRPTGESLYELYSWFLQERGIDKKIAKEDLKILGENLCTLKEERIYNERKGSANK